MKSINQERLAKRSYTGILMIKLKFFTIIMLLLLPLAAASVRAQQKKIAAQSEKPLPNLTLKTIEGAEWSLHENRGRVVLINFWATWCGPCREEIPVLIRLSNKYKAAGLEVVGINVDSENLKQVKSFIKNFKIRYSVLLAVSGSRLAQQEAVPMTLLIDKQSLLVKKYIGAVEEKIFDKDIRNLLGRSDSGTKQKK